MISNKQRVDSLVRGVVPPLGRTMGERMGLAFVFCSTLAFRPRKKGYLARLLPALGMEGCSSFLLAWRACVRSLCCVRLVDHPCLLRPLVNYLPGEEDSYNSGNAEGNVFTIGSSSR